MYLLILCPTGHSLGNTKNLRDFNKFLTKRKNGVSMLSKSTCI